METNNPSSTGPETQSQGKYPSSIGAQGEKKKKVGRMKQHWDVTI
jgi:hypothetical protein